MNKKYYFLILLFIFCVYPLFPARAGDVGIGVNFCSKSGNICSDKYGQHESQFGCDGDLSVVHSFHCENDLCVEQYAEYDCGKSGPAGHIGGPDFTCGEARPENGSPFVDCVSKTDITGIKEAPQVKYVSITPPDPCAGIPQVDSGARFTSISREVEVRRDCAKDAWNSAKMDSVLYVDDHVRTSEDSTAIIGFSDLSTFMLKPESEIVVTTPPAKDSKIKLVLGNIWANVKKMANNGTLEVDMSQAVAGIKGTTFVVSDDGKNSTLKVIEGTVAFTSKIDNKTAFVSTGEMITASLNGVQPIEKFDVAGETKSWDAIRTAQGTSSKNIIWYVMAAVIVILLIVGYLIILKKKRLPKSA